jgi:hypothetical protein
MATSSSSPNGSTRTPEEIPDRDCLFRRVKRKLIRATENGGDHEIDPVAFEDTGDGMSTSWCRHGDPESARAGVNQPHRFGVVMLPVGQVRAVPLKVQHTPNRPNGRYIREHADVIGQKTIAARTKLADMARLALPADPPQVSESEAKAAQKMLNKKH